MPYDLNDVQKLIEDCIKETETAHSQKYEPERADRTAALFLETQLKLSYALEGVELKVKHLKNEISRIEGEKYFDLKMTSSDKKITESALTQGVAKDSDVASAKKDHAEAEAAYKKFTYILNTLKDGHVYFRTLGKNQAKWNE